MTECFTHRSETNEYSIRWISIGSDDHPPLIFIHGTPWSSFVWQPYAKALSSRYKVYLFDIPGFGGSPGGKPLQGSPSPNDDSSKISERDSSFAAQTEGFAAFLKSWSLRPDHPPHVIAHDVGGIIALRANILHGCQYASLCLIDAVAVPPFGSPFFRLVAQNASIFASIPDKTFEGTVRGYIRGASFKPLSKDVEDALVKPWVAGGGQGQEAFLRQMVQADQRHVEEVEGRYVEVGGSMPVKIVWERRIHGSLLIVRKG